MSQQMWAVLDLLQNDIQQTVAIMKKGAVFLTYSNAFDPLGWLIRHINLQGPWGSGFTKKPAKVLIHYIWLPFYP